MKITQEPKFQPITITLETVKEARAFWSILDDVKPLDTSVNTLRLQLADWFSHQAQLGGTP